MWPSVGLFPGETVLHGLSENAAVKWWIRDWLITILSIFIKIKNKKTPTNQLNKQKTKNQKPKNKHKWLKVTEKNLTMAEADGSAQHSAYVMNCMMKKPVWVRLHWLWRHYALLLAVKCVLFILFTTTLSELWRMYRHIWSILLLGPIFPSKKIQWLLRGIWDTDYLTVIDHFIAKSECYFLFLN